MSQVVILCLSPMLQNNGTLNKENICLSSLVSEVDHVFFSLRKADQIIRRELRFIEQQQCYLIKKIFISPINAESLKGIIDKLPPQHLLLDEYIVYMIKNDKNSIFNLIESYNEYLDKRMLEQERGNFLNLKSIDEKLAYYIRHLGAMTYHLNIHLNLLTVLIRNASSRAENHQPAIRQIKDIMTKYMVNEWGERLLDVKFLEITIDEPYALVSWALEDIKGDAILIQDQGYWQLMNIRAGRFGLKDFENAEVPFEVAQRILRLHCQKLGD